MEMLFEQFLSCARLPVVKYMPYKLRILSFKDWCPFPLMECNKAEMKTICHFLRSLMGEWRSRKLCQHVPIASGLSLAMWLLHIQASTENKPIPFRPTLMVTLAVVTSVHVKDMLYLSSVPSKEVVLVCLCLVMTVLKKNMFWAGKIV